jgi:F0F1-type ATP synthase epsilon subunit
MKLGVYSLRKVLFQGDAKSVNCNTRSGEITILDHHEPLISILTKGVIKITDANTEDHYIQTRSGFLEIDANNEAKMLVEEEPA